jgi:basic membrane protein A
MSRKLYMLLAVLVIGSMVLVACGGTAATEAPASDTTTQSTFLACEVTDTGGIDDASFNQTAWNGVEQAMTDFGIQGKYLESQEQSDYETNINAFLDEGCNVIITVGFLLGDATKAAAEANPDQAFGIIDFAYDPPIPNVTAHVFATDQAAFLAGYAAAANTQTGIVGTFGGLQIPTVTVFMDGFYYGVQYYNEQKGTDVQVLGWDPVAQTGLFTGNFDSLDDGSAMGASLMDEGADIIMPVAGPVGLGTAAAIQERGNAWLIGVDNDWTQTAPEYADIVLTSVLKKMDATVYQQIEDLLNGMDPGTMIVGTLESGGVGLADSAMFSADLKAELDQLKASIIAGDIQTAP